MPSASGGCAGWVTAVRSRSNPCLIEVARLRYRRIEADGSPGDVFSLQRVVTGRVAILCPVRQAKWRHGPAITARAAGRKAVVVRAEACDSADLDHVVRPVEGPSWIEKGNSHDARHGPPPLLSGRKRA
jgi:hypothetical protein